MGKTGKTGKQRKQHAGALARAGSMSGLTSALMVRALVALVAALAVALVATACGSDRQGFDDSGGAGPSVSGDDAITIEPPDAVLDVEDGKTPSVDYHAFLVHKDGSKEDVTSVARFRLDQLGGASLGAFAGATFTAAANGVGKTTVRAEYKTLASGTGLTLRLKKVIIAEGAPPDAPSKFGGADDPGRRPTVAYPPDGVMVPPNMNEIEWQYVPGSGNDLFELGVTGALLNLRVYFGCTSVGGGCGYSPSPVVWGILSSAGRGQDPMEATIRGTSAKGGATVGTSAKQKIAFGEEDILGGIYYWNAGAGATMRYEFGVSGQKAETFMNAPKAGASTCVGCHVLSRDGERISLGLDIPAPSPYKVFDVATRNMVFAQGGTLGGGANFFSFSPDKKQIMVSNGISLSLRDAATGNAIQETVGPGAMPDWSPDGSSIVYSQSKTHPPCLGTFCGSPGVSEASLFVLHGAGGGWGSPSALVVAAGNNNYYPSYSPDGAWVVFNRASVGTLPNGDARSSYDAPDATPWVVSAAGGVPPIALGRATSQNGDSWPKWMQRAQKYRNKTLLWLTFSSRRAYGLRQAAGGNAQIWMVAFDPEAAAQGKDPSYAAFWLPFQELSSGNHIAQWVTRVARKDCTDGGQCESGEQCVQGVCRPAVK